MLAAALPIYVVVAIVAATLSVAFGYNPLETAGWAFDARGDDRAASVFVSLGLGAMLAAATVLATRLLVRRFEWARELHADLRPVVHGAGDRTILALACASGVAEEILFRGLLVPAVGVAISTGLFALVHQTRGRTRVAWMTWAAITGLALALIFRLTGSLAGPLLAHVAINAANLRLLRDLDPAPPAPRGLGGLLRRA